jgi:hypothetical protein
MISVNPSIPVSGDSDFDVMTLDFVRVELRQPMGVGERKLYVYLLYERALLSLPTAERAQ